MAEIFTLTLIVIKWLIAIILGTTILFLLLGIGKIGFGLIEDFYYKKQEKYLE